MASDLLKKMAVLTKVSNSLGQNAQIDWQGLVDELITRKYLSFRGKDKEAQILTFISGFAFFLSSSYDLSSDLLYSFKGKSSFYKQSQFCSTALLVS